ncbi:MAG: hypothetical protein ACRBBK_00120 [Paracoccaceae bacterium]
MKHDPDLTGIETGAAADIGARNPEETPAPLAAEAGLHLAALSVQKDGAIALADYPRAAVLMLEEPPAQAGGHMAVIKPVPDGSGRVVVLGFLALDALLRAPFEAGKAVENQDIVLKSGRSELRLMADGRVRIKGDDLRFEANGRLGLRGAFIDLN